jgi:hypothetical protein
MKRLLQTLREQGKTLLRHKIFPAAALTMAGVFVQGGDQWGEGGSLAAGLTLIALAMGLGMAALYCVRAEADECPTAEKRLSRRGRWILFALLAVHAIAAGLLVRAVPGRIDCLTFQRDAVQSILRGEDPYGTTHANTIYSADEMSRFYSPGEIAGGRVLVGLQYPPFTLAAAIPGYLLGDIRYGYVLAILLSAWLLVRALPTRGGLAVAALLLLSPETFFVEVRCWTEPLVWLLLCAVFYAVRKKPAWLAVAFGLFLASKQYNVLALPLAGLLLPRFSWKEYGKLLAVSLAVATATLLPFAIWNGPALGHDLVQFHLAQPFRDDSVSFAVSFRWLLPVGPVLLLVFSIWAAVRLRPSIAHFSAAYAMALLLFFATGKQAFCNYYFLIGQAFFLAAACRWENVQGDFPVFWVKDTQNVRA